MVAAVQENNTQRRSIALTSTLVLHGLLLLFFILYKIITPIPPFEEKGGGTPGYELALGFSDLGMGDNAHAIDPDPGASQPESTPPEQQAEVLTSDVDESAVSAPAKPVEKPHTDKPKPDKPKLTEEEIRRNKQKEIDALMNNKGGGAEGRGTSTTPGTSGVPNGDPNATGGSNGKGIYGIGEGIGIELGNRNVRNKPSIKDKPSKSGKVVMDIWVDKEGKVVRTSQNTGRSTTLDQELVAIARAACMVTTFTPDFRANSAAEQKGAMIFIFELE